jgi:hypothetical protein
VAPSRTDHPMIAAVRAGFLLAMLCWLLALATSASAEGAWVLWSRIQDMSHRDKWGDWTSGGSAFPTYSKCWAKIRQYTGVAEDGSLADWFDWVRGMGRYSKRGDTIATESGVLVGPPFASEWRCLPDTTDPRGPREVKRR